MSESPAPAPFEPLKLVGATLDGRYRLTAHLATGGMGAVFRAEHVYMRKELALKVLRPDLSASADLVERFRREAEIAASLDHENIVRVTDFGRSPEGYLFLAMELLDGESLFDRLRVAGAMSPQDAVPILVQVCSALDAAHRRGVVHRDLKPENVFLVPARGGAPLAKILDFGIAKITDPTTRSETQAGMVVGTPEYLSPEQALGSAVDGRADIYAVGLMAWRMLAGRHPFKADDARGLLMMQATRPVPPVTDARPDLVAYPGLVAAVARACAKSAAQRHSTAADLARDLSAAFGNAPGPVARTSPPTRESPMGRWVPRPGISADGPTHSLHPSPSLAVAMLRARLRVAADRSGDWARRAGRASLAAGRRCWELSRRHPWISGGSVATVLAVAIPLAIALHASAPASRARDLIARGRNEAALSVIETALRRDPADAELRVLLGRALHRAGQPFGGVEAYEAAAERDVRALDGNAFADLAADLARERRLADRAARLLARGGGRATSAVVGAAARGTPVARLRALDLLHELGADDKVDRVAGYGALLADPDCELRKAAARRLGEIGNSAALPKLRELAQSQEQSRGFLGITHSSPSCGSAEAVAAARRIEATARRP